MAATSIVNIRLECAGLGPDITSLGTKFTDGNTPDDYRRADTILSTTEILLSSIIGVACSELKGLGIRARGGNVYVNTISTAVSTAGTYIPDGQIEFLSFVGGNSCVVALKGDDAAAAASILFYSNLT